jgi:hypothetical protein
MILSILIPTLVERRAKFAPLKQKINELIAPFNSGDVKQIELLILEDSREKTTGQKRNELADMAQGKFSVFIDDDDDIPTHYIQSIMSAINRRPTVDCVGFKGVITWNGKKELFQHKAGNPYSPHAINGMYLRPPNHLNPMLTEYIREIRFPDLTFAEDFDFCRRLDEAKLIKDEEYLNIIMYYYHYNPNK